MTACGVGGLPRQRARWGLGTRFYLQGLGPRGCLHGLAHPLPFLGQRHGPSLPRPRSAGTEALLGLGTLTENALF